MMVDFVVLSGEAWQVVLTGARSKLANISQFRAFSFDVAYIHLLVDTLSKAVFGGFNIYIWSVFYAWDSKMLGIGHFIGSF